MDELVFHMWVSTEDGCFVLDGGLGLPTERDTSPHKWVLGMDNFQQCHRFNTYSLNSNTSRAVGVAKLRGSPWSAVPSLLSSC